MNTVSLIILLCLIPAVIQGLRKGFMEQLTDIAAIFIGAWAAFKFNGPVGEFLTDVVKGGSPVVIKAVSFAILAIISIILVSLAGKLLTQIIKITPLSWLNKVLGLVFSIAKYALILALVVYLFDTLNGKWELVDRSLLKDSDLYCSLKQLASECFPYIKKAVMNGNA